MRRIFVGSSTRQISLTRKGEIDVAATSARPIGLLVTALREAGHQVEPWWEPETLGKGRYLLDTLIEKARTCDGGIFVMGDDDPLTSSDGSKPKGAPKGNVVLECGMFLASQGKENTFIIKDGRYGDISWPSDILGPLLPDLSHPHLCEDAIKFFSRKMHAPGEEGTTYIHSLTLKSIFARECKEWSTKALYLGAESARRWTDIETGPDYLQEPQVLQRFIEHIETDSSIDLRFAAIDNIISLGPGCGVMDNHVVSNVCSFKQDIAYIPIDINPLLVRCATEHIRSKNPSVRTPFSIVDDFEVHSEYVGQRIKNRIRDYRRINLFVMLGGTFSNLEGTEHEIVQKFQYWMDANDYLIVDAYIKSDDYSFEDDTELHLPGIPLSYEKFLANACVNKYLWSCGNNLTACDEDLVMKMVKNLPDFLHASLIQKASRIRYTELPGTFVTAYQLNSHRDWPKLRMEMLIAKRYKHKDLQDFMAKHFHLLCDDNWINSETGKGRGIFLVRKKKS